MFSGQHLAAIDLGSNSFHMIVVKPFPDGHIKVVDRLRESVRLGSGLDADNNLSLDAQQRALACLQRFGERLRGLNSERVIAVGTNTLRQASQARDFIRQAEIALGHPIAIISGHEEARLIYLGVAHFFENETTNGNRFVMDIGGGSTELIIGRGLDALYLESLKMGCVSMTEQFFPDGRFDSQSFKRAIRYAHLPLVPIRQNYQSLGWETANGASGTIRTVQKVVQQNGLSPFHITLEHLYALRDRMIDAVYSEKLRLAGLSDERKPVFAGGLAILIAVFESLGITKMQVSDWALREGLVYDRLQRSKPGDIRIAAVKALQSRFSIDLQQAAAVRQTAEHLFQRCRDDWKLPNQVQDLLNWAAELHEIGLIISHESHQKHGAYLLDNVDLPGFSTEEQHWLSTLVRMHRSKLSTKLFGLLDPKEYQTALYLVVILRLSVLLHRARDVVTVKIERLKARENSLMLYLAEPNLEEQRPLLVADLERESDLLKAVNFNLAFN
ncbi:MAG: Ppx/GppA phosphatase family protein [Thiofilum sp.]|uniref:Ppx/GppA phosphatase family protein n=1 Tax=Thiofilum sp. TaxID=2212733 RepID=UPI0025E84683|nr:Ppx/GppA phosphatase family protein [Thiofilum sp.]MBK8452571.1 Ppx/GppA family phosphatase [Thiofilum sp.]